MGGAELIRTSIHPILCQAKPINYKRNDPKPHITGEKTDLENRALTQVLWICSEAMRQRGEKAPQAGLHHGPNTLICPHLLRRCGMRGRPVGKLDTIQAEGRTI